MRLRLRLEAANLDAIGLGSINVNYFIIHHATLNGKEYRVLAQLGSVVFRPLVEEGWMSMEEWQAWAAVGEVGRLLYQSQIDVLEIENHFTNTRKALHRLAWAMAVFHPATVVTKIKWHKLLAHSVDNMRRFGPLSGVSSEIFESFHTVTRAISVHSNRRAPSRDIGREFAVQEAVRHVVRGGYFKEDGIWRQAGPAVISLMRESDVLKRLLGIDDNRGRAQGMSSPRSFPRRMYSLTF